MRHTVVVLAAGLVLLVPAQAHAARVLVLDDGRVRVSQDRSLDSGLPVGRTSVPACAACRSVAGGEEGKEESGKKPAAAGDPVKKALRLMLAAGRVSAEDAARYGDIYTRALSVRAKLGSTRGRELGYVIETLRRIARRGALVAPRLPALFLTLDRNREWWGSKPAPGSGARVRFGSSRVIFQYYPGHGLQLQPLANFGAANGYWYAKRWQRMKRLLEELVALRVERDGFASWEYYFDFGGGSPPWISGMTQGTAVQALARASIILGDPALAQIASQALGAFERTTPVGARVPAGKGAWYALYSFAPRTEVLNGMLQALSGLKTFAILTGNARAAALFDQGDRIAQLRIANYDTGAWSLYSRSGGRPGNEANLNYHKLNREFARTLCKLTGAAPYCVAAEHFTRYMREDPRLDPVVVGPTPARAGRGVRFNFTLSKVSRVGVTVSSNGRRYLSTSAPFTRGKHYLRWVPPRLLSEQIFDYKLVARDLVGNVASAAGTLRVLPVR